MGENIKIEETMIEIRDPKTSCFNFDLTKDVDENLKHKIEFIIKSNESIAKNKIKKTRLNNYCQNIRMKTIFMNTENRKMNDPHNFFLSFHKN